MAREKREEIRHPAFGVITVNRVSGSATLFGSHFQHQHFVTVSIHHAFVERDLSHDWLHHELAPIIEVEMTESQWGRFLSSFGVGEGTPVTIRYQEGKGLIERPQASGFGDREVFSKEVKKRGELAAEKANETRDRLKAMIAAKGSPTKADLKALENDLFSALRQLEDAIPWVTQSYEEATEKALDRAKADIEGYKNMRMLELAAEALGEKMTPEVRSALQSLIKEGALALPAILPDPEEGEDS